MQISTGILHSLARGGSAASRPWIKVDALLVPVSKILQAALLSLLKYTLDGIET